MAIDFDQIASDAAGLANSAVNIGFGAVAGAVEKGKEVLSNLDDKGANVRNDAQTPDIAKSLSDMFDQAGGSIQGLAKRLTDSSESVATRALDELILAHVRPLDAAGRTAYVAHVTELVAKADEKSAVEVKVESVEQDVKDAVEDAKDKAEEVAQDVQEKVEDAVKGDE